MVGNADYKNDECISLSVTFQFECYTCQLEKYMLFLYRNSWKKNLVLIWL